MNFPAFFVRFVIAILVFTLLSALALQAAVTFTYSYDPAGRLQGVNSSKGPRIAYVYDAAGNLLSRTVEAFIDSDADRMDDNWELATFATLARNGTEDFDGDGQIDLHEFISGTNPANAQSVLKIGVPDAASGKVTVSWQSVAGKSYRVQYQNGLGDANWIELPGQVAATGATASAVDNPAAGASKRFYRVVISQ